MKIQIEKKLRVLPLHTAGAAEAAKPFARQRVELDRRAEYVKTYFANRDQPGFQKLDPVLAFHLGLDEKK